MRTAMLLLLLACNSDATNDTGLDDTGLDDTGLDDTGLDDTGLDDTDTDTDRSEPSCDVDNGGCGSATFWSCDDAGGTVVCTDVDECATNNGGCGDGTFNTCVDNDGAAPTCGDVLECAADNGGCGDATYWTCTENEGAAPTCADILECATNNGGCGPLTCVERFAAPQVCLECVADGEGGEFCPDGASCKEIYDYASTAPTDGGYVIDPLGPDGESFYAWCDMDDGGWTLLFNEDEDFDKTALGVTTALCHSATCTNRAYSTVTLGPDLRFDTANSPIAGDTYLLRSTITGIHVDLQGQTLEEAMNTTSSNDAIGNGWVVEADDNSNVENTSPLMGSACNHVSGDLRDLACTPDSFVFTINDDGNCNIDRFAIGGSNSSTSLWNNCAGWPEDPYGGWPSHFRVWTR